MRRNQISAADGNRLNRAVGQSEMTQVQARNESQDF